MVKFHNSEKPIFNTFEFESMTKGLILDLLHSDNFTKSSWLNSPIQMGGSLNDCQIFISWIQIPEFKREEYLQLLKHFIIFCLLALSH